MRPISIACCGSTEGSVVQALDALSVLLPFVRFDCKRFPYRSNNWKRQLNLLSFCLHLDLCFLPIALCGRLFGPGPDVIIVSSSQLPFILFGRSVTSGFSCSSTMVEEVFSVRKLLKYDHFLKPKAWCISSFQTRNLMRSGDG